MIDAYGTGLILSRMDGEWPGIVPGDITIKKGALTVQDKGVSVPSADVTASGISLTSHTHTAPHGERQPARTKEGGRASCPSWHRGTARHGASPRADRRPEWRLGQRGAGHREQRRQGGIPGHQDQGAQAPEHELRLRSRRRRGLRCPRRVRVVDGAGGPVRPLLPRRSASARPTFSSLA